MSEERGIELGKGRGYDVRFPFWLRRNAKPRQPSSVSAEVVIRFTGATNSGMSMYKSLDYFTRQGTLTAELNTGRQITGQRANERLTDSWMQANALHSQAPGRQSVNIVLSVPPGHDAQILHDGARAWAKRNLANFDWAMARHDDTDHPHVHIAIRAVGYHGKRLSVPRAESIRWREDLAQELRSRGMRIEATTHRERRDKAQEIEDSLGRSR